MLERLRKLSFDLKCIIRDIENSESVPAKRAPLTKLQNKAFRFIESRIDKTGCSPLLTDIMKHMGWRHLNSARHSIAQLEAKGWIRRKRGQWQSIEITNSD